MYRSWCYVCMCVNDWNWKIQQKRKQRYENSIQIKINLHYSSSSWSSCTWILNWICVLIVYVFVYSFYDWAAGAGFDFTAGWPWRKPLRKRLCTIFKWRVRPVPVVLLLLAFTLQLYWRCFAFGYPQEEHVFFWLWYERRPQRRHCECVFTWRLPNDAVPLVIFKSVWLIHAHKGEMT